MWLSITSKSIIIFDVKGNPGYNKDHNKKINSAINRNIKFLKDDSKGFSVALDRGWISEKDIIEEEKKSDLSKRLNEINRSHKLKKAASNNNLYENNEDFIDVKSISYSNDYTEEDISECKRCTKYFKELKIGRAHV